MNNSQANNDGTIDPTEPLWDLTPQLNITPTNLSPSANDLLRAAETYSREVRCFDFVPSNYVNAWNCLACLAAIGKSDESQNIIRQTAWFRHTHATDTDLTASDLTASDLTDSGRVVRFCEWGSGLGVVTGLAGLLGFKALGIELDERLSQQSHQMLSEQTVPASIICGSYFDDCPPADVYYVYGWPSQRAKILELFLEKAPAHALLLLCDGQDLLRVLTRWPAHS